MRFTSQGWNGLHRQSCDLYRIAVMGTCSPMATDCRRRTLLGAPPARLGEAFEVLNFGQPGFNTPDIAALLRQQVRGYQPDFILVQWFVNDVEGAGRQRPMYRPLLLSRLHEWLHRTRPCIRSSIRVMARWQVTGHSATSYADYMKNTFGDPQSAGALDARLALRSG